MNTTEEAKDIAEKQLGQIDWQSPDMGYARCPGIHLHTTPNQPKDCRINLDRVATLYCVHSSCKDVVAQKNGQLRSALSGNIITTKHMVKAEIRKSEELELLAKRAKNSVAQIIRDHPWVLGQIEEHTANIPKGEETRVFLDALYEPDDYIWMGDKHHSGEVHGADHFKTREGWKGGTITGPLIGPNPLKPGSTSRSNGNIAKIKHVVVESDTLSKDQVGSIFRWLNEKVGLRLRAIVDTGGKSLHGWFQYPADPALMAELEVVLSALGCDQKMFTPSQPSRLPGVPRPETGQPQRLLYLAPNQHENTSLKSVAEVLPLPMIYFQSERNKYWRQDRYNRWIQVDKDSARKFIVQQGYSSAPKVKGQLSSADECLLAIDEEQNIAYAGPLAGYKSGIYEMNGQKVLVTDSPRLIEPKEGEWRIIEQIIDGMFNRGQVDQRPYFYGWLHHALCMYHSGRWMPGQVLVLAGEPGSGKSLVQDILTEVFGGRSAYPYHFLTKGTDFNADLFPAEHLVINDEAEGKDYRARRALGAGLKQYAVVEAHRYHQKQRTALTLLPRWRVSVSVNDEPERLMVLPPMDDDIRDKITLLKVARNPMPMPTGTDAEREAFWKAIKAELPAFVRAMLDYQIPEELREDRFGICAYQHPDLLEKLEETRPEQRLLEFIDRVCFVYNREPWIGTAVELLAKLHTDEQFGTQAKELTRSSNLLGQYLSRLAEMPNPRVTSTLVRGYRRYTILPPRLEGGGVDQINKTDEINIIDNREDDGEAVAAAG